MKKTSFLIAALALLAAHTVTAQDFIRQTQLDDGLTIDHHIHTDSGDMVSLLPLPLEGSKFDLFARGNGDDTNLYWLDSKVINAYMPRATLVLQSEDPAYPPRTRADRPYTLEFEVTGMLDDPEAPDYARQVLLRHTGGAYPGEHYSFPGNSGMGSALIGPDRIIAGNLSETSQTLTFLEHSTGDPTKTKGEETYTIFSLSGESSTNGVPLASQTIRIFPVGTGEIRGVTEGQVFLHRLPNLEFRLRDMYPRSLTYAQLYEGPADLGATGVPIAVTVREYNTIIPQNENIRVEDWGDYISRDGIYTIELLTITPFNDQQPERLDHVTFEVKRTVRVDASLIGSD